MELIISNFFILFIIFELNQVYRNKFLEIESIQMVYKIQKRANKISFGDNVINNIQFELKLL
jgi:hypothetical protein